MLSPVTEVLQVNTLYKNRYIDGENSRKKEKGIAGKEEMDGKERTYSHSRNHLPSPPPFHFHRDLQSSASGDLFPCGSGEKMD